MNEQTPIPDDLGEPQVPPDLPAAYAEAYRRAYYSTRQSLAAEKRKELDRVSLGNGSEWSFEKLFYPDESENSRTSGEESAERFGSRWWRPVAVTTGILVLVAGAYALGSVLTGDGVDTPDAVTPAAARPLDQESAAKPDDGSEAKPQQDPQSNAQPDKKDRDEPAESQKTPDSKQRPGAQQPWKGSVATLEPTRAKAGCVYPPSVDAAGKKVHYRPSEAIDADPATAWRCAGRGAGQSLTIKLGEMVRIAEVGLVAGYAKTDPSDGTDRYAENNRITKVRWSFDSGESFVQRLDPSPKKRGLQLIRIPVVKSENVTITILGSARGPRNTVAISEVSLARVTKAG